MTQTKEESRSTRQSREHEEKEHDIYTYKTKNSCRRHRKEPRWSVNSSSLFQATRRIVHFLIQYLSFQGKGKKGEVFEGCFSFTRKGLSSYVKQIFITGRHDCGVDLNISGVLTPTEKQHIPVCTIFVSRKSLLWTHPLKNRIRNVKANRKISWNVTANEREDDYGKMESSCLSCSFAWCPPVLYI